MTKFPAGSGRANASEAADESADRESAQKLSAAAEFSSSKLLHNIKGFIFDFDGTLFDHALLPFRLISAYPPDLFRLRRERIARRQFAGCDYYTPEEYFRSFFTMHGKAGFRSPQQARDWYFGRYMPRMIRVLKKHYKLRPGVTELFRQFSAYSNSKAPAPGSAPKAQPRVAIYSDYPFLKERLEALGLYPGSSVLLFGPDFFGAQKPAARPFLCIAKDFGVEPEEVLVIGDREETDGLGAFKAGMKFFCLETGRKRHFRLDPNRRPEWEEPHGPSLLMHAGSWEDLVALLMEKYKLPPTSRQR
ncbi:MAG: HAD family hydrolase [Treponema sp.]|nr:HAD family hydrolase [Treponema sp.]